MSHFEIQHPIHHVAFSINIYSR